MPCLGQETVNTTGFDPNQSFMSLYVFGNEGPEIVNPDYGSLSRSKNVHRCCPTRRENTNNSDMLNFQPGCPGVHCPSLILSQDKTHSLYLIFVYGHDA